MHTQRKSPVEVRLDQRELQWHPRHLLKNWELLTFLMVVMVEESGGVGKNSEKDAHSNTAGNIQTISLIYEGSRSNP